MYAIIQAGGKQMRVEKGDLIDVELPGGEPGSSIEFKEVLVIGDNGAMKVGSPHVAGSLVRAEFLEFIKGPKVVSFKYKRRKNYRRKVGHRQQYARVKITEIAG